VGEVAVKMAVRKRGYDGAVREQLADLQRSRMLAAMFDVAAQRGVGNVTVARVVERSGVSRRTFYELFSDREDCLRAAFEQALAHARGRVLPVYEAERDWRDQIRAAVIALLCFLDEQPVPAKLLIAELHAGAQATSERREEVLAAVIAAVDRGRAQSKASPALSSLTAEGVVGGALSVIHSRLAEDSRQPLLELANPLMGTIVLPYLGSAAARRELGRLLPQRSRPGKGEMFFADPFKEAGIRLTYRTVRVLIAIAELAGRGVNPSNRLIADAAEINDQGQISKLLHRLECAGLIANTNATLDKGTSNSWALTEKGAQVASTIGAHSENGGSGERER
jgi:AcrR family transcriptional regulator/DNA-binding MarR family transcriptional regulator